MEIEAINRRVIGLDIHQTQITAYALVEDDQGGLRKEHRQFGGFKRAWRYRIEFRPKCTRGKEIGLSAGFAWPMALSFNRLQTM